MSETKILLETGTNELEIIEFYLDEARGDTSYRGYYGINVAKVLEIIQLPELTEMPEVSHRAVLGAFNLRDKVIPLIDLAAWLGRTRAEFETPKVIVTEFNRTKSAFLVSGVTRIHRIGWREVEAPTNYVSSLTANSITGVVKFSSRIVFILDMEKICMELNPDAARVVQSGAAQDVKADGAHALLVDDSKMARNMISNTLSEAGFRVHTEDNGEMAWNHLLAIKALAEQTGQSVKDYIDVVITDVEMPAMDGHTLTRFIKEDPELRQLPVILCSSIITDTLRHKGIVVGADDQVSKAELDELAARAFALVQTGA